MSGESKEDPLGKGAKGGGDDGDGGSDGSDAPPIIYTPSKEFWRYGQTEPEPEEYTVDHMKLLYMISRYAICAQSPEDPEGWVRQLPLNVLMYQGITAGALDFDYAPCSSLVSYEGRSRRIWLNITQEGKAAVDDLRERELLNGLKLSTEDFQPVTAYQVSLKGLEAMKLVEQDMKDEVDDFLHCPPPFKREVMKVMFDGETFFLVTDGGFSLESTVTETEDVSYVSSPFLPTCLRNPRSTKKLQSNAHRAHESAMGESNIRDELSEAIVLGIVNGLVGEWIPFGSNQIVALNERLGALDRCQGGLFTAMVDKSPTDTQFDVPPGLTQVTILDFDFVHFINFEAEINFPEDEGIVQVENFGMHLNVDGTIVYGVKVEAILDRSADDVSLDHLSRLLVDVHQDSSSIMNDLLSQYQRSLLDMIFMGDIEQRNKFNCILAEQIKPKLSADEYMDKGEYENELKQVIGDIRAVHDLGPDDVIMMGRDGILLAGPHVMAFETQWVAFVGLLCREIFVRNFFIRTFVLDDVLKTIRHLIMTYMKNPNNVALIREKLNHASRDIILLQEVLEYLKESLEEMYVPPTPKTDRGRRLYKVLGVPTMRNDMMLRCTDLVKLLHGAHHQLFTLQGMTEAINTKQLEDVFKNVETNTKFLVDASAASERASASLEVMQIILAGSFAFDIVDRLSGGTLNIVVPSWVDEAIVAPIIAVPMLFFFLNMMWLALVSVCLMKFMKYLAGLGMGFMSLRVKVNRKVDNKRLQAFLDTRAIKVAETVAERGIRLRKVQWAEEDPEMWQGAPPAIELFFDATNGFLLTAAFQIDTKKTAIREKGLMALFDALLKKHKVYDSFDSATDKFAKRMSVVVTDAEEKAAFDSAVMAIAAADEGPDAGKRKKRPDDSDDDSSDEDEDAEAKADGGGASSGDKKPLLDKD